MQRIGMVIKLNADKVAEYKRLHADVWPEVLDMIIQGTLTWEKLEKLAPGVNVNHEEKSDCQGAKHRMPCRKK